MTKRDNDKLNTIYMEAIQPNKFSGRGNESSEPLDDDTFDKYAMARETRSKLDTIANANSGKLSPDQDRLYAKLDQLISQIESRTDVDELHMRYDELAHNYR
jgi:hypothetical protein